MKVAAILHSLLRRPLSRFSSVIAVLMIVYSSYEIATGNLYIKELNWVDSTALIMIGALWLRIIQGTKPASDLQSFTLALATTISFTFTYEAVYKYSFYLLPFLIPPHELRELAIQIGLSLLVLVGFAQGLFSLSKLSKIFGFLFVGVWLFWVASGFPQLFNLEGSYHSLIDISLSYPQVYLINRSTKFLLLLVFFFLPSRIR